MDVSIQQMNPSLSSDPNTISLDWDLRPQDSTNNLPSSLAQYSFPTSNFQVRYIPEFGLTENIILIPTALPATVSITEEENPFLERTKDFAFDHIIGPILDPAIALIGGAVVYSLVQLRNRYKAPQRKSDNEIAVELFGFERAERGTPYLSFQTLPAIELDEFLDEGAIKLFLQGLKASRHDAMSFMMFDIGPEGNPHELIGYPLIERIESALSNDLIQPAAALARLNNGLNDANASAVITQFFGFFTCDDMSSIEHPRFVLLQKEDLLNNLLNFSEYWRGSDNLSRFSRRDNKTNLARILEFAVCVALRHPQALFDIFPDQINKVRAAILKAETYKKLLVIDPENTVGWLETFLSKGLNKIEYPNLPDEFKLKEGDWDMVLQDWYRQSDIALCLEKLRAENAMSSFAGVMDVSIDYRISMWLLPLELNLRLKP